MGIHPHWLPDVAVALISLALLGLLARPARTLPRPFAGLVCLFLLLCWLVLAAGGAFSFLRIARHFPNALVAWTRAAAIVISTWTLAAAALLALWRLLPSRAFDPGRRAVLRAAKTATFAAPAAITGFAILRRDELKLKEIDIPIRGLPKDLDGLRLAQISDIHLSPLVTIEELRRAVAAANETRPHIALVTGDLISRRGDPLDACIAELAALRSDAGTFGCLGNHEIYAGSETYTTDASGRRGMRYLRNQSELLRFGTAALNLAGVDYQQRNRPYLQGAGRLARPDAVNILLSHNPDVFPVAAKQGFDLTLSGHTHGGQISVEILHQHVNVARFFTPYVYGLYREKDAAVYVTRGIGTVGIPARLGAPPEVALIRLCAS